MSEQQWNASLYESDHAFVWQYGGNLIELLAPQLGEHILDLGCGTGQLTAEIAALGAKVVGIDHAPTMVEKAQANYPQLKFAVADATDFSLAEPFDAVFSNAVLHWIQEPEKVIRCIWQALKPGGRFVAEFGGLGNVKAITTALTDVLTATGYVENATLNPWYFPSIGEYTTLLEKQGFEVSYASLFDRPTPLKDHKAGIQNWLKMFASRFFQGIPEEQQPSILQVIENQLRPVLYRDETWFADYRRLRVIAQRS
ncbi:trans-aconitate 2-methyltransferase [Leptolyngbya sp. FACHB-261]|uniref:class I SAM-dependent methyltransferase n=1 Tax=Leptolyngbya sp. FACHB-261 TaxID=2692806 RepID=UPI0016837E78|nr:class I SAM-dependent methyltransferase [Leptolyngbya sp. FACHB-261]MBD2105071.1 class I SAM-dependent methyltransferase [Leptolyngbya sp. FACHB-261]